MASELLPKLSACWPQFNGSDANSMSADKLDGRMEEVYWVPPILSFKIERHGGTVLGSSRAEKHWWELNIEDWTAASSIAGHRQLTPKLPELDVLPLVRETAHLISRGLEALRLGWREDGSVRINIGQIIPDQGIAKATVAGRRRRFQDVLTEELRELGWEKVRANLYRRKADSEVR